MATMSNHTSVSGIYVIHNSKNGHIYLGQAQDFNRRWNYHKRQLKGGYHDNDHLQKAWNKYGAKNFQFKVLEYCPVDQLNEREQHFLDVYMAKGICYNIARDATAPMRGRSPSAETRKKLSEANKGRTSAMKGKTHSEETRRKISEAAKGRTRSPEHCQNLSKAKKGVPKSEEHKRKLSEVNKGKKHSEETRKKMSESRTGLKFPSRKRVSAEVRAKMSLAQKLWRDRELEEMKQLAMNRTDDET
jgi:group I intron endonuclease